MRALIYFLYTDRVVFQPLASGQAPKGTRVPSEFTAPAASANALFSAADKLGLDELKDRAANYIKTSLTCDNLTSEFNQLHAGFHEVERDFVLQHWDELRNTDALKRVMSGPARLYPGLADVFPSILKDVAPVAATL